MRTLLTTAAAFFFMCLSSAAMMAEEDEQAAAPSSSATRSGRPSGNAAPHRPGDYSGAARSPNVGNPERPSGNAAPHRPGDLSGAASRAEWQRFLQWCDEQDAQQPTDVEPDPAATTGSRSGYQPYSANSYPVPVYQGGGYGYGGSYYRPGNFQFSRPGDFSGGSSPLRNFFPRWNRPSNSFFGFGGGRGGYGRSSSRGGGSSSRPSGR